jgi:hypothetical protein
MKYLLLLLLCLCGCEPAPSEMPCVPLLPEFPPLWKELFGVPGWRLEWIGPGGRKEVREITGSERTEITLIPEWPSPVLAFPFVPGRGIRPGTLKPAGGIFPFDVSGSTLRLSWQGGVDASFYWELAAAYADAGADAAASAGGKRKPQYFDWPRFRELFTSGGLAADVVKDPWLAGWKSIAQKTVQSGFSKSRIKAEDRTDLSVPVNPGPWAGTSPFAAPVEDGIFPVRNEPGTWYSASGALRCSTEGWIMLEE